MIAELDNERPLRSLVRHTAIYGSGYVTMAIASVVLVPVYTHHLSTSQYGLLGLMLVLYGLMRQLYDLGFTTSVGRFFFDHESDSAGLVRMRSTALTFLVSFGALLTAVLWAAAGEWSRLLTQSARHADLVRIVAITLYAEGVAIVPLTMMRMQERSRLFVLITLVRFIVTLSLSIILVALLDMGVEGALIANAISAVAVLVVLLPDYLTALRGRPSWLLLRQMLAFGIPFFPVILSSWFIEASDRYLLGLYRSQAEVGYYVLGYKVAQVMQIALAAFAMGWAPLRYRISGRKDAAAVYRRLANYYAFVAALLTFALAVFAREIVSIIAPRSYAPAALIVPLIAFGYALNGLYILMVTGMGVTKRTRPLLWIVGGAAAVNLGANIVLIPLWGMRAAAVTTVLANMMMVAGSWYYSEKVYPIPYDWRRIFATTAIGAGIAAAVVWLTPGHGIAGLGAATAAWLLYAALLVGLGVLPTSECARIRAYLSVRRRRLRTRQELAR